MSPGAVERLSQRLAAVDWAALGAALHLHGSAVIPQLLAPQDCRALAALYAQDAPFRSRVVMQVVVDEALDEVVAVVMARVAAQGEGLSHLGACSDQGLGLQLLLRQPGVGQSLIDQDAARVRRAGLGRHQRTGVVGLPGLAAWP